MNIHSVLLLNTFLKIKAQVMLKLKFSQFLENKISDLSVASKIHTELCSK